MYASDDEYDYAFNDKDDEEEVLSGMLVLALTSIMMGLLYFVYMLALRRQYQYARNARYRRDIRNLASYYDNFVGRGQRAY